MFGKLISEEGGEEDIANSGPKDESAEANEGDVDLKEHMVGILFSRSKLSHLQKQVCQKGLNFYQYFIEMYSWGSMLGFKLICLDKKGPWWHCLL